MSSSDLVVVIPNHDLEEISFPLRDDCFAVRQAARYLSQLYERHLKECGITSSQFTLLMLLSNFSSMSMAEIAAKLVMDRTTVVRAIQPLVRYGLIADMPNSARGASRRRTLQLTDKGRVRLEQASLHWHAAQDEVEQRFGAARTTALRQELLKLTRIS